MQTLLQLLAKQPHSAKELMQSLQLSQPSVSRLLKTHNNIIKIGKARATQYALKRPIRNMGYQWPVYRIDEQAHIALAGQLIAVYPHGFVWHDALTNANTLYEGLPWFLWDIRPQGFLGREFKQIHLQLGLPERLPDWQDDDVLVFLLKFGFVQPSCFIVGDDSRLALNRLQQDVWTPAEDDGLAQTRALYGQEAGKVVRQDVARDIVQTGGRTFLEVVRFDRTACLGRKGMVSLDAVSNEFVGHNKAWDEQAVSLFKLHKINEQDYQTILKVFAFGKMIANEDMHNGNLSFFLGEDFSLNLAPLYDMLPMRFAPNTHGEVVERDIKPTQATLLTQDIWPIVSAWAKYYWLSVSVDVRVSDDFKSIAKAYLGEQ